jgi:peptidoglycan/LPS O-acetylase OafA/YrhL
VTAQAPKRYQTLQVLRAVAAFLVVFYHIESSHEGTLWHSLYTYLFSRGHIGVDIFFVLSGYLVTSTRPRQQGARAASAFLIRRLFRIWPAYAVVTLIYALWLIDSSSLQVLRSLVFLPQAREPSLVLGFPTLFIGWTLNYEAWFYLSCALLILATPHRYFHRALALWAAATLLLLPLIFGSTPWVQPLQAPAGVFPGLYLALVSNPIIWEFLLGSACALLLEKWSNRGQNTALRLNPRWLAWGSVAIFATTYLALDNKMEPIACGIPALILLLGLLNLERHRAIHIPYPLVWLGNISYGIYLVHPVWLKLLREYMHRSAFHEGLAIAATLVLTIISAALLHYLIEKPAQSWARQLAGRLTPRSA